MRSLVEVLSIERDPEAYGHARSKLHIICESSNAPVVDLGLLWYLDLAKVQEYDRY